MIAEVSLSAIASNMLLALASLSFYFHTLSLSVWVLICFIVSWVGGYCSIVNAVMKWIFWVCGWITGVHVN